jgi:alpha-mannosidase
MTLRLHLISHTHWDREWYLTFQQFRLRLVHLMDELLEMLETNPDYQYFMMDGQTIVLDDYLQIRPEREAEIRARVDEGRLLIGPWHILPDEFLVSPEATVRNLLEGERTALRFGRKMQVGYIPDPFGHIGQMPQILRGFGIETACLQRGLSDEPVELWWQAPDGSRVFLSYLRDGYGNAAALPTHDAQRFQADVQRLAYSLLSRSKTNLLREISEGHLLLMQGTDHMEPLPSTAAAIAAAQGKLEGMIIEHSTLPRYMQSIQNEIQNAQIELETVSGELRSGKRHPLLPGVMSARIWIKQRNQACENLLEKWAEPFSAWAELGGKQPPKLAPTEGAFLSQLRLKNPASLLRQTWRLLMENHPHDSICGCSVDQVHEEMRPRFDQVEQVGEEITKQSLEAIARAVLTQPPNALVKEKEFPPVQAVIVFNPTSGTRTDRVKAVVPLQEVEAEFEIVNEDGTILPHQTLRIASREIMNATLDKEGVKSIASAASDGRVASMAVRRVSFRRDKDHLSIEVHLAETGGPDQQIWSQAVQDLQAYLNDPSLTTFTIKARSIPAAEVIFTASQVPGIGYRTFWVRPCPNPAPRANEVGKPETKITNEHLSLSFSAQEGAFTLHDLSSGAVFAGLNRFTDGGDIGDEYNYAPPAHEKIVDEVKVKAVRTQSGPVEQSIEVDLEMIIPDELAPGRRARSENSVSLAITTRATLVSGTARVEFTTVVDNCARDHRLRVHFPVPFYTNLAEHDGHFEVVSRPVGLPEFDSTWIEQPRGEVPQRHFSRLASERLALILANRGLPEVEALENESGKLELALTLLRCVGWLSRDDFSTRKGHAGPMLATPGAQMQGRSTYEYALIPGDNQSSTLHYKEAYAYSTPLRAAAEPLHTGELPWQSFFIEVTEPAFEISAIKLAEEDSRSLIVRGYNLRADPLQVSLAAWHSFEKVEKTSLSEQPQMELAQDDQNRVFFQAGPHEIVTLKFS